jgi:hypothetical protein
LEFISPKVILSRTSNFGVATYEVVKMMMADGLVGGEEGWEDNEKEDEDEDDKEEATGLTHELPSGADPLSEESEAVDPTKL